MTASLRRNKLWMSALIALVLVVPAKRSDAIIPVIAGWLLAIGGDAILITDIVAGMGGLISGAVWYDCNKFSASSVCTNKPSSMPQSSAPGESISVMVAPDAQRPNPDSTKFNDAAPGARDVTPKSSIAPSATGGTQSTFGPNFQQVGSVATLTAGAGQEWVAGNFRAGDSTSAAMMNAGVELAKCAASKFTCVVKGPYGSGNTATYDIRNITGGGNSFVWTFNVSLDTKKSNCGYGYSSDLNGNCVKEIIETPIQGCGNGYTMSGNTCTLTDANQVKKPTTTPCQVLYDATNSSMLLDSKNANCDGMADNIKNGKFTLTNADDGSSITITRNANGGFDITKNDGKGHITTVSTGPYDNVGKGYPIVTTTTTKPAGEGDGGSLCGIAGKPPCAVSISADGDTTSADGAARSMINDANANAKSLLDNVDTGKFNWSFIPDIPSAECVNPQLKNPLISQFVSIDICGAFNKFQLFLNGVLAVLCVYGCARQIRSASKA